MNFAGLQDVMLLYAANLADENERALAERWLESGHPAAAAAYAEARAMLAAFAMAVDPVPVTDAQWSRLETLIQTAGRVQPRNGQDSEHADHSDHADHADSLGDAVTAATEQLDARRAMSENAAASILTAGSTWRSAITTIVAVLVASAAVWLVLYPRIQTLEAEVTEKKHKVQTLVEETRRFDPRLAEQAEQLKSYRKSITQLQGTLEQQRLNHDDQEQQIAALRDKLDHAMRQFELVTAPTVQIAQVAGTEEMPGVVGRAYLSDDQSRVQLSIARLTPPARDRTYQFWLLTEGQDPTSLGIFPVDEAGTALYEANLPAVTAPVQAVAVSLEVAGGVPAPTGPIVAKGALQ